MSAGQWDCSLHISSAHYRRNRQFLKAEEFQRNSVILTGKYKKGYRLHVAHQFCMLCYVRPADTKTTRGKLRTWQHSVPTWCFLWRLLRCARLEAAQLDRSVCVIKSTARAIREQTSPNAFSRRTLMSYDCHTLLSRDTCNRSLCGWKITFFFHIAILSQMQLIVQP